MSGMEIIGYSVPETMKWRKKIPPQETERGDFRA